MADVTFSRKLVAEFLGTGALVYCGPGTAAATFVLLGSAKNTDFSMAQLGMISFAFMLVIVGMVYTIGHISGCHINPAVTVALAATRKFPWAQVPGYVLAQAFGGIAGALAIYATLGAAGSRAGLGSLSYSSGSAQAFFAELIGTFLLVLVVFGTATDSRAVPGWAGLAIASVVFAIIMIVGPVTGAAINPARYFGPMVVQQGLGVSMKWAQLPVYVVAQLVGALLAGAVYSYLGAVKRSGPASAVHLDERVPAAS
jgi:glycerol uptake facilitator protein